MNILDHKKAGTLQESADTAKQTIKYGCQAIREILTSVIGPNGALKLLSSSNKECVMTNDGATILKNLLIDSPAAQILIDTSIAQDKEEGDGTTTVALLAALLVEKASTLEIHPLKILKGYEIAARRIEDILQSIAFEFSPLSLAKTTLSSKILRIDLDKFSDICVQAVNATSDNTFIHILKVPGSLEDSYFVENGFMLENDAFVSEIKNPRILIANTGMDYDKVKIYGAKIDVQSIKELSALEEAEKDRMRQKIDKISFNHETKPCSVKNAPKTPFIDLFINRQIMYDLPKERFKQNGVIPIDLASFEGVDRLHKVLGGSVISSFYSPIEPMDLGTCEKVYSTEIADKKIIVFSGIKSGAGTIVLRGSSDEVLNEAERSIHDALCVLRKKKVVPGGGATESMLANQLYEYAKTIPTVESTAVIAFADCLFEIVKIIAHNCGFSGEEIKAKLRSLNTEIAHAHGIDIASVTVSDMREKGIVESYSVKSRVFKSACETAQILIKCDGYIRAQPRERTRL